MKLPRWDVWLTLDGHTELQVVRARDPEHAAWIVALDMADRGFGDRTGLVSVDNHDDGSTESRHIRLNREKET